MQTKTLDVKEFKPKTVLRWTGSKRQLLGQLHDNFPDYIKNKSPFIYVEPFCGTGIVRFSLIESNTVSLLNDCNKDLINFFYHLKHNSDQMLILAREFEQQFNDSKDKKQLYYNFRNKFNEHQIFDLQRACLFWTINRTCFNGVWRVNSKGLNNVPCGTLKEKYQWTYNDDIKSIHEALQNTDLSSLDYRQTLIWIKQQQAKYQLPVFMYCDPPYKPIVESEIRYNADSFDDNSQVELANFLKDCDKQGIDWLLSNSCIPEIHQQARFFHELYSDFIINEVITRRYVSGKLSGRGVTTEIIIKNY